MRLLTPFFHSQSFLYTTPSIAEAIDSIERACFKWKTPGIHRNEKIPMNPGQNSEKPDYFFAADLALAATSSA